MTINSAFLIFFKSSFEAKLFSNANFLNSSNFLLITYIWFVVLPRFVSNQYTLKSNLISCEESDNTFMFYII